jgi:type IV pilus assembly protein PilN
MVRINLLPIREILRKRELKQFIITAIAIFSSAVLIAGLTYALLSWKISDLQAQEGGLKTKLAQLKEKTKEIDELKNRITRLQKQVNTIQNLIKTRDTPAPFMSALSLAIPDEVYVTNIQKTGRTFTIDGVGADNTAVVKFVQDLQRVRQDLSDKRYYVDPNNPSDRTFFSDVKLLQIVAAGQQPGMPGTSPMNFKIVGSIREAVQSDVAK